ASKQGNQGNPSTLTITFNETMQNFFDTSKMHITTAAGDTATAGAGSWNATFTVFTIPVSKTPNNGVTYSVTFHVCAFKDVAGNGSTAASLGGVKPAGVAGEGINLGLIDLIGHHGEVTLTISGVPSDWTLNDGTRNTDGTWIVSTNDVSSLAV